MTKKDVKELDKIKSLTKYGSSEIQSIEDFVRKHIDPNCKKMCRRCPSEARFALRRIKAWEEKNQVEINSLRDESNR